MLQGSQVSRANCIVSSHLQLRTPSAKSGASNDERCPSGRHRQQRRADVSGSLGWHIGNAKGLVGKQVELALELIPGLAKLGFVVNVATGVIIDRQELEKSCQTLGIASIPA